MFIGEVEDADTFMIAFGDREDESGVWLELQRALFEDEQDHALGMDISCLVRGGGSTFYGGVVSCVLARDSLELHLDEKA